MIIITISTESKSKKQFQHEVKIDFSLQQLQLDMGFSFLALLFFFFFFFFNNSYGSIYKTEFEQAPRDGERQGSLACCSPWDRKESDTTEQQQIDLSFCLYCSPLPMCFIFPCGTTASKSVSLMALALCLSCTVYSRLHLLNKAVHRLLQLSFLRS